MTTVIDINTPFSEYAVAIQNFASCVTLTLSAEKSYVELQNSGAAFTIEGPAEFKGNILEHPDTLWTEDVW